MGTKQRPGAYDCYAAAEPDEPMFVLLARDANAPEVVEYWIACRLARKAELIDGDQLVEAQELADAMRAWRLRRGA